MAIRRYRRGVSFMSERGRLISNRILVGGGGEAGYRRWRQRRAVRRAVGRVAGLRSTLLRTMVRDQRSGMIRTGASFAGGSPMRFGRMIGNRLQGATPVARGTSVYTTGGGRLRPGLRVAAVRNEGAGGGTNPSQRAYRNSARYRERHGLAA